MAAYRCSACSINWPRLTEYRTCPQCEADTSSMMNETPVSTDEAKRIKSRSAFEKWLQTPEGRAADRKAREDNDRFERELAEIAAGIEAEA